MLHGLHKYEKTSKDGINAGYEWRYAEYASNIMGFDLNKIEQDYGYTKPTLCSSFELKIAYDSESKTVNIEDLSTGNYREMDAKCMFEVQAEINKLLKDEHSIDPVSYKLTIAYEPPKNIRGYKYEKDIFEFDNMEEAMKFINGSVAYDSLDNAVQMKSGKVPLKIEDEKGNSLWKNNTRKIEEEAQKSNSSMQKDAGAKEKNDKGFDR